jgi:hypothetical protein
MFINIGQKDGIKDNEDLLKFIVESTDIEPGLVDRITVREMASFFNVGASAAEFIQQTLSTKKLKGRKIRVEEAEHSSGSRSGGGSRDRSGSDRGRPSGSRRSDSNRPYGRGESRGEGRGEGRGGSQKFNKRY